MGKFGVLPDHDALVKERAGMSRDESDAHYIRTEMLDPLMGGLVIGASVEEVDGLRFPRLAVRSPYGKVFSVIVSSDDEMNDGGRLMIEEEVSNG
jgi:hypothetical protein